MFRLICGLVLAWLAAGGAARACSVVPEYFVPLNYDLVRMADSIVLARRNVSWVRERSSGANSLRFEVVETIAGEPGPDEVMVLDMWDLDDPEMLARRSDHDSLSTVHPDVHSGPCDRVSFPEDAYFVFFLTHDGEWSLLNFPMARTREDVPSRDSLWVWAIQHYAAIASLDSDVDQYAALVALRNAPPAGPLAWQNALRRDISEYLQSETTRKAPDFLSAQISDPQAPASEQSGALIAMASVGLKPDPMRLDELSQSLVPLPLVSGMAQAFFVQGQTEQAWSVLRGRLVDVAIYGSYRDRGTIRTMIADSLAHLPLDVLMEAYAAFSEPEAFSTWDTEITAARLAPLATIEPQVDPRLSLMLVRFGFVEPLDWARETLRHGTERESDLAIRLIADAISDEGDRMRETMVCERSDYHSAMVRALGQSADRHAADWIYAVYRHPDADHWAKAEAQAQLLRMAMENPGAYQYFEPASGWNRPDWRLPSGRAWRLAQAIANGEEPPAEARLRTCVSD